MLLFGSITGGVTPIRTLRVIGSGLTSHAAKTVTQNYNAQVDTSQSKFGGASALFSGTNDNLQLDSSPDFTFGTGDFTIDFWMRPNVINTDMVLYDGRPAGTNGAYATIYLSNTNKISYLANNATRITGTTNLAAGTWYHVALARSGTATKLFLNGTQEGSTYTDSTNYLPMDPTPGLGRPLIGIRSTDLLSGFNGWIDELRVSKGIARWTTTFTPPTAAYTPDTYTVLLLHMDGANGSLIFTDAVGSLPNRQIIIYPQ